jgi:NTP pyrophosphatase (non-canonical NTP hydrolase)
MEIKSIQKRIMDFTKQRTAKKGFELTTELSYIHLTEELGEVARQISNKKMRPELYDESNLKEEIADVMLESMLLANTVGMDLDKELNSKIDLLFKRHGFKENK